MKYIKYLLEGLAIAAAAYYLPQKKTNLTDVLYIGLVGAITFALLDMFAPSVGEGARVGSGFGIGANHVGFGEGFTSDEPDVEEEGFYNHHKEEEGFFDYEEHDDVENFEENELIEEMGEEMGEESGEEYDNGNLVNTYNNLENESSEEDDVVMPSVGGAVSDEVNMMPNTNEFEMPETLEGYQNYASEPSGFNLY